MAMGEYNKFEKLGYNLCVIGGTSALYEGVLQRIVSIFLGISQMTLGLLMLASLKIAGLGKYACAYCHTLLFDSSQKFESYSGWPSFTQPIELHHVGYHLDRSYRMTWIETTCNVCDAHLGNVFLTGLRQQTWFLYKWPSVEKGRLITIDVNFYLYHYVCFDL